MTSRIWLDDETFSPEPITNGTHKYAEGAEVMIRALALGDDQVVVRDLTPGGQDWLLDGDEIIPAYRGAVALTEQALANEQVEVWAHNSHFDRTVERHAGLQIPLHRWRDTMVQALAHSLPGALGALCEVLRVDTDKAKDKAGKALINLFCKPIKFRFRKREALLESVADYAAEKAAAEAAWSGRATRETHPAEWRQFMIYAGRDILAMRECHRRMPSWNYGGAELALWHLDQQINDRGVAIDLELAEAAVAAVDTAQEGLRERTSAITNGEVESATKRDAMLLHVLAEYGVDLPDLQMATLERRIADPDLPTGLRELLSIRLQASTTSTSKYKTLMRGTSSDGRLRGLLQFCGAARTGRWAGRLWQPQNLPRPVLKQSDIDVGIEALKDGCAHLLYDNVMELTSSAIRGCIVAPPGKKLVVADLSNIEGRVLAWLAGETWKVKAFADFDAGTGFDLYALAYAKSFGVTPQSVLDDKKAGGNQRQIGKVQELALGYEGGVGAFLTFAAAYGIDLEVLGETGRRAIPGNVWGQANIMFDWHLGKKGKDPAAAVGLSKNAWLVCESFKLGWREAHPAIKQFWRDIDEAVRAAIDSPGRTFLCRVLKVRRDGAWLRIGLPSGRALCYPSPEIVDGKITYMGVNQYSRKWARLDTYGGKLAENCIGEGTEVLTLGGWRPIETVRRSPVWDGVEWVEHSGCIYKGKQVVLIAYGVEMTPDHLVLTGKGWKNASSCEGLDRADVGLPNGYKVCRGAGRAPVDVGSAVRLRKNEIDAGIGIHEAAEARDSCVVRLHASGNDRCATDATRHDGASSVRGVAQHERSLPPADAPSVSQLRRAGHRGVRFVAAFVRGFLGRYGADVRHGEVDRAQGKFAGVRAGQLPVAVDAPSSQQPTWQRPAGHSDRPHHAEPGRAPVRDWPQHPGLAPGEQLAALEGARPVYDLMNCGPRKRFVVRGADGRALIVHNCTQAVARDVMANNFPAIEDAGYAIVLSVHDEGITETPDQPEYNPEHLSSILATVPDWAPGLPLAAAGFEAYRYKKE